MKNIVITKSILKENTDVLKDYFKDISRYPVISGEDQVELAKKCKLGDKKSRDMLIKSNLRFVVTCAKQYSGQGVPLMDLINAGNLGLIQSLENYDPERGIKFLSFAVWYIRREILREIYNNSRTIRYPITYISKITKVKRAYDSFLEDNQREPNKEELQSLTNLTDKQIKSVNVNKSYCQSLETPVSEDDKSTLEDLIPDNSNNIDIFTKESILKALKILSPREYKVITKFYGLNGESELAIKDIAKEMGLGAERVRQLRKESIKKLRQRCGKTLSTLL